ncbi:MAG: GspE/PulE family protein [Patescibacteria group bacterium]
MFTYEQLKKFLVKKRKITQKQLDEAQKISIKANKNIEDILIEKKFITKNNLLKSYADFLDVEFIDLSKIIIRKDILFKIPEKMARKNSVIAFDEKNNILFLAMEDPQDLEIQETIKKKTKQKIQIFLTTEESLEKALAQYQRGLKAEFSEIIEQSMAASRALTDKSLSDIAEKLPIVKIVDTLLKHAILQEASDIHIEPQEGKMVVRYRIDGVLHDVIVIPREVLPAIIARIKILANLKIDEHRLPQDGRFKTEQNGIKISYRVSVLPVMEGEKIAIRLLNEATQKLTLEQLGFLHSVLQIIKRNIQKPHGMILVTGPTGCGKTTTLYSILNILNTPDVNICTVEDPIEYRLPRINQSQIRPKIGFTFATGIRTLVRQDPDIIMVGEIRDLETAEMAINAALTGHLVLSTLHTNNAAGAATRLIDMGVKPFLISSTLNLVIAQRLVRRLCPNCIEKYHLTSEEIEFIKKNFDVDKILEILVKEKITAKKKDLNELTFYRGRGCEICNQQGYKGRIGIFEVFETNEKINKLILKEAAMEEINKAAQESGMTSLSRDGFIKALTGVTTIEEVLREAKE